MIAKVVTSGPDRPSALSSLQHALAGLQASPPPLYSLAALPFVRLSVCLSPHPSACSLACFAMPAIRVPCQTAFPPVVYISSPLCFICRSTPRWEARPTTLRSSSAPCICLSMPGRRLAHQPGVPGAPGTPPGFPGSPAGHRIYQTPCGGAADSGAAAAALGCRCCSCVSPCRCAAGLFTPMCVLACVLLCVAARPPVTGQLSARCAVRG
jgi:hypothetical protein